ncbi:MAG TPA: peptidylprolyl isomerase [Gaiellaceae bacterium]|nr:peptidylprolyl isomerase [Gaiellaceae bacterium]
MGKRLLVLGCVALAAAGCGGSKKSAPTTTVDAHGCIPVAQPPPTQRSEDKPSTKLDPSRTYDVTFETNCGNFTVRLAVKQSPNTTASFAHLVDKHFFDHTLFHRIAPDFVIQGGDPTQSGEGGPGYETVDKPAKGTKYVHGTVAMAKTPAEPAGTGGSQFFVVTAVDAGLPPDYALLGHVVKGIGVVDRIGKLGNANEEPIEPVVIERATVATSK